MGASHEGPVTVRHPSSKWLLSSPPPALSVRVAISLRLLQPRAAGWRPLRAPSRAGSAVSASGQPPLSHSLPSLQPVPKPVAEAPPRQWVRARLTAGVVAATAEMSVALSTSPAARRYVGNISKCPQIRLLNNVFYRLASGGTFFC